VKLQKKINLTKDHYLRTQAPYWHMFVNDFHLLRVPSNMFAGVQELPRNMIQLSSYWK